MTVIRTTYEDLPSIVRTEVEEPTGPVRHATAASAGLNSAVAATLHTNGEAFFIKALPADARDAVAHHLLGAKPLVFFPADG